MADEEKTASAAKKDVTAPKKADAPITGARIIRMRGEGVSPPALIYRGDVPKKGVNLRATLDNGVTYHGIVADATEVDGEVLVEFRDGLTPEIEPAPARKRKAPPAPKPRAERPQPDVTTITPTLIPD